MAIKDDFTTEEWTKLVQAPMLASMAVTAADPSGLVGAVQEATATSRSMLDARGREGTLAAEVVAAFQDAELRKSMRQEVTAMARGKKPAEVTAAAVAELASVASLVRGKAPDQAAAFNDWLRELASRVAEAASEGGFLGFGGEKVSDEERRTLADIDAALQGGSL